MGNTRTDDLTIVTRPVLGGLETEDPPNFLAPQSSPDLQNITFHSGVVEKRGGFVPLAVETARMNSLYHAGKSIPGVLGTAATTGTKTAFLQTEGWGCAGHRTYYDDAAEAFTVEMVYRVGQLPSHDGGNGALTGEADALFYNTGAAPGSPYQVRVRPLLSKGPIKKSNHTAGTDYGSDTWTLTSAATGYGPAADAGLPFALYLFFDTGLGRWVFRLSYHEFVGGNWNIRHVTHSTSELAEGQTYHIIAVVSQTDGVARLRVGRFIAGSQSFISYSDGTGDTTITGTVGRNECPILLLDCPAALVVNATGASATERPGLGLSAATAGGWWYASKRAQGQVEDICIWRTDKLSASTSALDRPIFAKLDLEQAGETLLSYWSMDQEGRSVVRDRSGFGNDLFLLPAGPLYAQGRTASPPGAWWFNGRTSYALADIAELNPNWNQLTTNATVRNGYFRDLVLNSRCWGVEAAFWPDQIDPNYEQVVVEIHGVLRVAVGQTGALRVRIRNDAALGANRDQPSYRAAFLSTTILKPGHRYVVSVVHDPTGANPDLRIFINGTLDSTHSINPALSASGHALGAVTIGMGSYARAVPQKTGEHLSPRTPFNVSMDSRSAFCGTIESVKLLGGAMVASDIAMLTKLYKDESIADYVTDETPMWQIPGVSTTVATQEEDGKGDTTVAATSRANGRGFRTPRHIQSGKRILYPIQTNADPNVYQFPFATANAAEGGQSATVTLEKQLGFVFFVLAHWKLNVDDGDEGIPTFNTYQGKYVNYLEDQYEVLAGDDVSDWSPHRYVWQQYSQVSDNTEFMGNLIRRCIEHDQPFENLDPDVTPTMGVAGNRNRCRRFPYRCPAELAVGWRDGLLIPRVGENPVTLVADYSHQESKQRYLISAVGRNLYWLWNQWHKDTPFVGEPDIASIRFFGDDAGYVILTPSVGSAQTNTTWTTGRALTFECFYKPYSLDGTRIIALRGIPDVSFTNWALWAEDGQIHVGGTMGSNTAHWHYVAQATVGATPLVALRANEWNHIHITVGDTGAGPVCYVHINGILMEGAQIGDPMDTDTPDSIGGGWLFLGGLPRELYSQTWVGFGGSDLEITWKSSFAVMSEVRMLLGADANWPRTSNGAVPRARYSDTAATWVLLHFNQGQGFGFNNAISQDSAARCVSNIRQWVRIGGLDDESRNHPFTHAVFRDSLYISNGIDRPREITFQGLTNPDGPFKVRYAGKLPPPSGIQAGIDYGDTSGEAAVITRYQVTALAGPPDTFAAGLYQFWITFVDAEFRESDPVQLAEITTVGNSLGFQLAYLPRSPDPQVTRRYIYASPGPGAGPLLAFAIEDNETDQCVIETVPSGIALPVAGTRLPAPRARYARASGSHLIFANLTDPEAGWNAIAFSSSEEPTWFDYQAFVTLDSTEGNPITGIEATFGRVYMFKRSATWMLRFGRGEVPADAVVDPINNGVGLGGGVTSYDNVMFGAGERGVYRFDSSNFVPVSRALDGEWPDLDLTDEGFFQMAGVYDRDHAQYWLGVRLIGDEDKTRVYVMHTALGPKPVWSKYVVPPYKVLHYYVDPVTQRARVVLGTTSGAILTHDDDRLYDGVWPDDPGIPNFALIGATTTLQANQLTISAGTLPIYGLNLGLRGATIRIFPSTGGYVDRYITAVRETGGGGTFQIHWDEPLTGIIPNDADYRIGSYASYWSSPWLAPQQMGSDWMIWYIDLEVADPTSSSLALYNMATGAGSMDREFDTDLAKLRTVTATNGVISQPIPADEQMRGRYHRIRFGNDNAGEAFRVIGWALRGRPAGTKGGVT